MKKILKSLVFIIIILILCTYSSISIAANSMSDLKKEKNEINNQISETKDKIEDIKEEKSDTLKEVEKLTTQISNYQEDIDEAKEKISKLESEINIKQDSINEKQKEYSTLDEALGKRLVAMYKTGETSYLDYLLNSSSFTDFLSSYYLISQMAEYDTKMLREIKAKKEKIESEKAELETAKRSLDAEKKALIVKQDSLKNAKQESIKIAKKEKNEKVSKLSESEKKLEQALTELTSHERTISKKIAALQAQYDAQKARRGSGGATYSGGGNSSYGFGWPVVNHAIGTSYGVAGRYWSSGYHTGVDFPVGTGTPVYSIGDGQVVDTGYNSAYGNFVEIYHGNNIYSFYAHASRVIVSIGQYVSKGQQIMYSGATGNVTGAHLHFEIRTPGPRYANCVNPMNYLP